MKTRDEPAMAESLALACMQSNAMRRPAARVLPALNR